MGQYEVYADEYVALRRRPLKRTTLNTRTILEEQKVCAVY